jgi:hypothetical protein
MVAMDGSRPAFEYATPPNPIATDDAPPRPRSPSRRCLDSGALPPWTPPCRCDGTGETLARGVDRDGDNFGWRRGRATGETRAAGVGGGGYIVAPHQVGLGRTGWFHLVQPGSDRLAHLGL